MYCHVFVNHSVDRHAPHFTCANFYAIHFEYKNQNNHAIINLFNNCTTVSHNLSSLASRIAVALAPAVTNTCVCLK